MNSLSYTTFIERSGGNLDMQVDYYIEPYNDPEDGESFSDTSWTAVYTEDGGAGGGDSGFGTESNAAYLSLGLPSDALLHHYTLDFTAQNTFSGDSVFQRINVYAAPYATTAQIVAGTTDDDIEIGGSAGDSLTGGDGNDTLDGGDGDDTLDGGAGQDRLTGGAGSNVLKGGADDDTYIVTSPGDTIVEQAGGGYDTVYSEINYTLAPEVERLVFDGGGPVDGTGNTGDNRIDGNGYANRLSGLDGNDMLIGNDGTDTLIGGAGDDTLDGGAGIDSMTGGAGNDLYWVDSRYDKIVEHGGEGTDTVTVYGTSIYTLAPNVENMQRFRNADFHGIGNNLANTITGGGGDDTLEGLSAADTLVGGAGNDTLVGGSNGDALIGGTGTDVASYAGSAKAVSVDLAAGTASGGDATGDSFDGLEGVTGTAFDDRLNGDANANILSGGDGSDIIHGRGGDDTIIGGAGGDTLDGGNGSDTLSYAGSGAGVTVNLATHIAGGGDATGDIFSGFENLTGSGFADTLTGNTGDNLLSGGRGIDTLDGGDGDDVLMGGAGGDTLIGGTGSNTLAYYSDTAGVTVSLLDGSASGGDAAGDIFSGFRNLSGGGGNDTLTGDAGANGLSGGGGNDMLIGGGGNDYIKGGAGGDVMDGGAGIDTISYSDSNAGVSVDLQTNHTGYGTAEGDTISGFENILGSAYGDVLYGDTGANRIEGGAGNDLVDGRGGNDVLVGGAGADTFVYTAGYSKDVITDFAGGGGSGYNGETIELSLGAAFDTYSEVMAAATMSGNDTIFNFGNGDTLTVKNVAISAFAPSDITFG